MRFISQLLFILILSISSSAWADLPELGDPTQQDFSPSQERQMGLQFYKTLKANIPFIEDLTVNDYLSNLGQRLVSQSDKPDTQFKFFMLKIPSINAFAGPDAYIGIHSGLFLAAKNESELAGVLAHEISHVSQRHIARAMTENTSSPAAMFAAILAGILVGAQSPDAGAAIIYGSTAAMMQAEINFTRHNEHEADRIGIAVMRNAGINPNGMAEFFETLLRKAESDNALAQIEYLRTHPLSTTRIAEARDRITESDSQLPSDSLDFQLSKAQVMVSVAPSLTKLLHAIESIQVKEQDIVSLYTRAITLIALDRSEQAIPLLQQLIKTKDHPWFQLALAKAFFNHKEYLQSQKLLEKLNNLYPNYIPVTIEYARILNFQGQNGSAIQVLKYLLQHKNSPVIYQHLAQAYHANGQTALAIEATSYQYELEGYLKLAVQQVENALKQKDLNTSTRQRLQGRKTELMQLLKTENMLPAN